MAPCCMRAAAVCNRIVQPQPPAPANHAPCPERAERAHLAPRAQEDYDVYVAEPEPLEAGQEKHVISVFVADEAGLINRVAGVFARRGARGPKPGAKSPKGWLGGSWQRRCAQCGGGALRRCGRARSWTRRAPGRGALLDEWPLYPGPALAPEAAPPCGRPSIPRSQSLQAPTSTPWPSASTWTGRCSRSC